MEAINNIKRYIQHLYNYYGIKDSLISMGYNEVSETYLVMIKDAGIMKRLDLQQDLFDFSQQMAEEGEWILFVSPDDCVHFDGYEMIGREWTSEKSQVQKNDSAVYTQYPNSGWDVGGFFGKADIVHVEVSTKKLNNDYAFAA